MRGCGAIFELKAVEALTDRHRGQLLNYLFLADLPHGKLVNLQPQRVEHEFVNAPIRSHERRDFTVIDADADPESEVEVQVSGHPIGTQLVRLAVPDVAIQVTTLATHHLAAFEVHLRQFLRHTGLRQIQWINVARSLVQFKTIR
jgi:hypothetical protein